MLLPKISLCSAMAQDWQVDKAKQLICWPYQDEGPIRRALTAGDTESDDREGHRMLAQLGDSLVAFIIATICFKLGITRCTFNYASSTNKLEKAAS